MKNTKLTTMIEGAIIAGICVALSFVPLNTANASFDISLGLIPLGVYALRRGLLPGMAVGFVWGLLLIVLGKAWFLSIPQVLLEYPVAFAFGGFGGILSMRFKNKLAQVDPGSSNTLNISTNLKNESIRLKNLRKAVLTAAFAGILAAVTRWFFHFWAGLVFWMDYMPDGINPYLFNFIANGGSAAANAIILAIVLSVLVRTARKLFTM